MWTTDQGVEQSVVDTPCLLNDGLSNIVDTMARVRAGEIHFNDAVGGRSAFFPSIGSQGLGLPSHCLQRIPGDS